MKLAVIIPDRGDRPDLLKNCLRMMDAQIDIEFSRQVITSFEDSIDITKKYKAGYSMFPDYDLIAFIENDDWYAQDYLSSMVQLWRKAGEPDIFGLSYSIYYHLGMQKYFVMRHHERSSAMNTFIKPNLNFAWPADDEPFLDMHLWRVIQNKATVDPGRILSVGMKGHNIGLSGGFFHNDRLHRYINDDNGFLQNTLDEESFKFYSQFKQHASGTINGGRKN